jgi:hypothetical protein
MEGKNWIYSDQGRYQWHVLFDTVVLFRFPGTFCTSCLTIGLKVKVLVRVVT